MMGQEDVMSVQSVNPATGEVLETIEEMSKTQIEQAVARAHAAFLEWRTRPFPDRARLMRADDPISSQLVFT